MESNLLNDFCTVTSDNPVNMIRIQSQAESQWVIHSAFQRATARVEHYVQRTW